MSDNSAAYDVTRAFHPEASVFVAANAGAGKTSLLTNRVLSLLLHGVPPAKILCLTFTNAAAAEMKSRVLAELGEWIMADEAALRDKLAPLTREPVDNARLLHARSLLAAVLEAPEGVRIQTIHGFCQSLLRRFPIEAGVSPHFTVIDARTEQEMLGEARLRLFNRAQAEDPALQESLNALAHRLSETSFHDLMHEIVTHKRKFRALFGQPHGVEAAMAVVWEAVGLHPATREEHLPGAHFSYDGDTLAALRRIAMLLREGAATDRKTGEGLAAWLASAGLSAAPESVTAYVQLLLTNDGPPRKQLFTKKVMLAEAQVILLQAEQQRAQRYREACNALGVARQTVRMLHVAEALLSLYDTLKRSRALMDYDDLILTACGLLERPGIAPWVLFKLDGGIDHILVDEAQDTSPEQWRIVEALTQEFFAGEGRKELDRSLFVVGDEKQSIFSFQGARPAELARMQQYFSRRIHEAAVTVHSIALMHSFRSARQVLSAVDAVFTQPQARAGLMFGDSVLSHLPTVERPGLVELWPLIRPREDDPLSPMTRLARGIAETIYQWIANGQQIETKHGARTVNAGDIMILVRRRGSLVDRLVRALKKRDVPVAGQDRMKLGDNLAVQDLVALGRCLLLPEDELTLAGVLKSPIFAIDETHLFTLAHERGRTTLWERLQALSADAPYGQAYALLSDLRARADYASPYELYSYLLDTCGARQRFAGRMGSEYHDPIDEFLGQALLYERAHTASLQGFIHWLSAGDSEIRRDMEQATGSVRIMTVHGAKGLQAPIVILPDTLLAPSPRDRLLWQEDGAMPRPFWPPAARSDDSLCRRLRQEQKQADLAEYRRLLYVAMTRAEDRLYICGAGKDEPGEDSWYSLVRGGLAPLAQEFDLPWGKGLRLGDEPPAFHGHTVPAPEKGASADSSFAFLLNPAPAEPSPPQPLAPSRPGGDEPAAASPLDGGHAYARGNLVHRLLQYLPDMEEAKRVAAAEKIAVTHGKGLPGDVVRECISQALAVMAAPRYAFLFGPQALAEVPVAGCVEMEGRPVAVAGQIDRLHVGASEVWIVDFKSNRRPPGPGEAIPAAYLRQMRLYRLLLQQIYPDKTVRCALLWTASAMLTPLDEAQLDEAPASSYI